MKEKKMNQKEEALKYHSEGRPGKIEVIPTKPYNSQKDLTLAYSPGVAYPCLEIEKNPEDAYKYTSKGNLVAVISNGTAVLGLGNIGALAGKPVMEGKGLLFKTFADIDVFDIEVGTTNIDEFISTVKNIAPTFGGINLEDIKAPECFEIEERLKKELDIPVMHDDQHGTAIISAAALLSALEVCGKKIEEVQVVVNGAGAASAACSKLYFALGVKKENLVMCDSKGVISKKRTDLNAIKAYFATERDITTLEDAVKDADVFLGLSVADVLTSEMVKSMAKDPVVFALANPNPEIAYDLAMASRPDIIFATGRSDYPNQVNNVLGFPYIFRGALDVRATKINEEMKIAAVRALADLAKEPIPDMVAAAYNNTKITFGKEYLIPKALDPRLITHISIAVAKAAIESGVARKEITDWEAYRIELEGRMGRDNKLLRAIHNKALTSGRKRIVFEYGEKPSVIKAAVHLYNDGIVEPILLGNREKIETRLHELNLELPERAICDFRSDEEEKSRCRYGEQLYHKLHRRGLSLEEAKKNMSKRNWFSLMMVDCGDADGAILEYGTRYTETLAPVRAVFQGQTERHLAAMVIEMTKQGPIFFSDMAINFSSSAENLAETTRLTMNAVKELGVDPVAAMLSYSNFGTGSEASARRVSDAVSILHEKYPDLIVDGEIKADIALNSKERMIAYPFSKLGNKEVNTLIFPNLSSGNISYKLVEEFSESPVIGPVLLGLDEAPGVHLISDTASSDAIMNLAMIAAVKAGCAGKGECVIGIK